MFKVLHVGRAALLAGLLAAVTGTAATPASAAQVCGDRDRMAAKLDRDYRELPAGIGLTAGGAVIELFTAETGTWTILMTLPGDRTCVMSIGEGWEHSKAPRRAVGEAS